MHVDIKYNTPDVYVSITYVLMNNGFNSISCFSRIVLPYIAIRRWAWNGNQQTKNATTTATKNLKRLIDLFFHYYFNILSILMTRFCALILFRPLSVSDWWIPSKMELLFNFLPINRYNIDITNNGPMKNKKLDISKKYPPIFVMLI